MKLLRYVWAWLIRSSADPKKFSLTIKSILMAGVSILAIVGFNTAQLPQGVDMAVDVLEKILLAGSSVSALWGFVRKVHLTRLGAHASVNALKV